MLWWTLCQLESDDSETRLAAMEKLGARDDPRVGPALIARLADDDFRVRSAAARALGRRRETAAIPRLILNVEFHRGVAQDAPIEALADMRFPGL